MKKTESKKESRDNVPLITLNLRRNGYTWCGCLYLLRSHNRSVKSCMRTRSQACMVFSCPSVSIIQFTSIKMKNVFRFIYVIGCQINGVSGGKLHLRPFCKKKFHNKMYPTLTVCLFIIRISGEKICFVFTWNSEKVTLEFKFVSLHADTKTLRILTRGNAVHLYLGYQVYVNWEHCTSIPKFPSITTIPALLLY